MPKYETPDEYWQAYLTGTADDLIRHRRLYKRIPGEPRCNFCFAPFGGLGGWLMKLWTGIAPSSLNPHLCNV